MRANLLAVIASLIALSFGLSLWGVQSDASATFYLLPTRLWELALGGLAACAVINGTTPGIAPHTAARSWSSLMQGSLQKLHRCTATRQILSVAGLLLISSGLLLITKATLFPGAWALLPTMGTGLVILAGPNAWMNSRVLSNQLLVWIGLISYPLYLWHWPLLAFSNLYLGQTPTRDQRIAIVGISILLAWLTYRFLEKPFRSTYGFRQSARILLVLVALAGLTGYIIQALEGIPSRTYNLTHAKNAQAFVWPENRRKTKACELHTGLSDLSFCLLTPGRLPTAALIGDSHANAVYDFVETHMLNKTGGLVMLGQGGCPPFIGVERDSEGCPGRMNRIVEFIGRSSGIKQVFITGRFAATLEGANFGGETPKSYYQLTLVRNPAEANRRKIFKEGFENMLKALDSSGKRVTVLLDVPELDFDPRVCLRGRVEAACSSERTGVFSRQAAYTSLLYELQAEYKFKIVDLKSAFCSDTSCQAMAEGRVLYRDSHHLGKLGNDYLARSGLRLE